MFSCPEAGFEYCTRILVAYCIYKVFKGNFVTYQEVLTMDTNNTKKHHDTGSHDQPGILYGVTHGEHTRAYVALEKVHQGLQVPKISVLEFNLI